MRNYREIPASNSLAPYVECFWVSYLSGPAVPHTVLPDGCVDLIFDFSALGELPGMLLVGTMTLPLLVHPTPFHQSHLGIRFRPAAAPLFFDIDSQELLDGQLDLVELEPQTARRLAERIADTPSLRQQIEVLEEFLLTRLRGGQEIPRPIRQFLHLQGGLSTEVSVNRLSDDLGVSRQYFTRLCKQWTGTGPKRMQRILRFRSLIDHLRTSASQIRWAELALDFGYYDQAHLIRDFREFSGSRPREFVRG